MKVEISEKEAESLYELLDGMLGLRVSNPHLIDRYFKDLERDYDRVFEVLRKSNPAKAAKLEKLIDNFT